MRFKHGSNWILLALLLAVGSSCSKKNGNNGNTPALVTAPPSVIPGAPPFTQENDRQSPPDTGGVVPQRPIEEAGTEVADLREQIIKRLSDDSPLAGVVRMKVMPSQTNGLEKPILGAASARSFLKPLLIQEKEVTFGPFGLDVSRVQKNLTAIQKAQVGAPRTLVVSEMLAAAEELKVLLAKFRVAVENEGKATHLGESRRASEISETIESGEFSDAVNSWSR